MCGSLPRKWVLLLYFDFINIPDRKPRARSVVNNKLHVVLLVLDIYEFICLEAHVQSG
jgi:hypothetical protein